MQALRLILLGVVATLGLAQAARAQCSDSDLYLDNTPDLHCDRQDILDKADELETVLDAFKFVRNEIAYEVYYGSKKGALGTLWSGSGNDYDQASLLIALLRAKGIRARYAVGIVDIDNDQLSNWAGLKAGGNGLFMLHYCYSGGFGACATTPPRWQALTAGARQEHVWVEAWLPAQHRGSALGGTGRTWIQLDPSWKKKAYRDPPKDEQGVAIQLPIGDEIGEGDCEDQICFDYDAYYAKVDPRLASEVWEETIRTWIRENHPGLTPEDFIFDGPIIPYEDEVLPASLPFVPSDTAPVVTAADIGEIADATEEDPPLERRFRLGIGLKLDSQLPFDCTTADEAWPCKQYAAAGKTLNFVDLVGKRLTLSFSPLTSSAREAFLMAGGYLVGKWNGYPSLLEYCLEHNNGENPYCALGASLRVDGDYIGSLGRTNLGTDLATIYDGVLPYVRRFTVEIRRDLIAGHSPRDFNNPNGEVFYDVTAGTDIGIGLDANQTSSAQILKEIDKLATIADELGITLVQEVGDQNDNYALDEVLVDQDGTPGASICSYGWDQSEAMSQCDVALSAQYGIRDHFIGRLLHLASQRYLLRQREEASRILALDGYALNFVPIVGVARGGLHFDYLFDSPVGVEPMPPMMDVRGFGLQLRNLFGSSLAKEDVHREGRLIVHMSSALEHHVWEELIGKEFTSTVKGIQLVRERFPETPLYEEEHGGAEFVPFLYDPVSEVTTDEINEHIFDSPGTPNTTVIAPRAAVVPGEFPLEVFVLETVNSASNASFGMNILAGGQSLGGSAELDYFASSLFTPLLTYGFRDPFLQQAELSGLGSQLAFEFGPNPTYSSFLTGALIGDPVSMVSGNLSHTEADFSLRTGGVPFAFSRTYNSQSHDVGALGHGWTHSYEVRLEPVQDENEFVWLPNDISAGDLAESDAARSDTLDNYNAGHSSGDSTASWPALPAVFQNKVNVDAIAIEIGYREKNGFDLWLSNGVDTFPNDVEMPGKPDYPSFESYEVKLDSGEPYLGLGPFGVTLNGFKVGDNGKFYAARMRIRYHGPEVRRTEIELTGTQGLSDPAMVEDDTDPATCSTITSPVTASFESPPASNDIVAHEIVIATKRGSGVGDPGGISVLTHGTEAFLTGPYQGAAARQRFLTEGTSSQTTLTFDAPVSGDEADLCNLRYSRLEIPEQLDLVLPNGGRERFTLGPSGWVADPGVRSTLEADPSGPGFIVTHPDGRVWYLAHEGVSGAYHLTRIEDAQGRGLDLVYEADATPDKVDSVEDDSAEEGWERELRFTYDPAGFLDQVSDWTGRVWEFEVDGEDLIEARDPLQVAASKPGTKYDYSADNENPELGHNLIQVTRPKDADGSGEGDHQVAFGYNLADRVTYHEDSLGSRQLFLFNVARLESRTIDARGFRTIYRHDQGANLIQRVDPDRAVWSWEYDNDRNVTAEIDPLGRTREFEGYDQQGRPGTIIDRDEKVIELTYNPVSGGVESRIDKRGNLTATSYTAEGQLFRIDGTLGDQTGVLLEKREYGPAFELERVIKPLDYPATRQRVTEFIYKPDTGNRDVERIEAWEDTDADDVGDVLLSALSIEHDDLGRETRRIVERQTGPDDARLIDQVTETHYNARGDVQRVIRPDGTSVVLEYDDNGNVERRYLEAPLPAGGTRILGDTSFGYDVIDRLTLVVDAASGETQLRYDGVGNRIGAIDPEGHLSRVEYDALNRLVRKIDPTGAATVREYDAAGQLISETDPSGLRREPAYNEAGDLIRLRQVGSDPIDITRTIFYEGESQDCDEFCHEITVHNHPGDSNHAGVQAGDETTRLEVDELGRIFLVTDAEGGGTETEYDLLGNVIRVTDADESVTTFVRDALGRAISETPPHASQPRLREFDEAGNPFRVVKPDGCVIETNFDVMNRATQRRLASCPPGVDAAPVDDRFAYDARGNVIAARNAHVGLIREYDELGRLSREIDDRFGTSLGYRYDRAGNLTTKIYPDGLLLQVDYDAASRPVGITDPLGETTRYAYDAAGRRIQTRGASGLDAELAYDEFGRLASVESFASDGTLLARNGYPSHDKVGNRMARETPAGTALYEYDGLYRLVAEDPSNDTDPSAVMHYVYTAAGDRTYAGPQDQGQWLPSAVAYVYLGLNHRLQQTATQAFIPLQEFSYDANGNVVRWIDNQQGFDRTLRRDALDRLVEIQSATFTASFVYDPFGRRIEKTENGAVAAYQYDGLDVVAEYTLSMSEWTQAATYVFGPGIDEPLKIVRGTTVASYQADGLGSVVSITETGATAALVSYSYDAFGAGEETNPTGFESAYSFTGREADASGLYYYRARYYLPSIGRFLSPDPMGLAGGINAYAYVNSNPVNFRDPFGLFQWSLPNTFSPTSSPSLPGNSYALDVGLSVELADFSPGEAASQGASSQGGGFRPLSEAPEIVRDRVSPVEYDLLTTAINDIDRAGARTFEGEIFQAYNIGPGGVIEESGVEKQACGYDCRAPFEGLRSSPTVWAHSHNRYGAEGPSEFDRPIVRKQGNIGGVLLPNGTARLFWYDPIAARTRVWTMRGTPSREDVR